MGKIYITGHRNPDIDSLCAASAYANLKNLTDSENEYIAIHCSPVSDQVREQMEAMGIEVPPYKKDVFPKVRDVMLEPQMHIQAGSPIFALVNAYNEDNPSVVPIYDGTEFKGLLSVDDITGWFLTDNKEEIPVYNFTVDNILRVIPGKLLCKGKSDTIEGSLLVGAGTYEAFGEMLDEIKSCIVVLGPRKEHLKLAVEKQVPAIIIAATETAPDVDFSGYEGSVFMTSLGTAETLRRIRLAESIESMMETATETIDIDDLFVEGRRIFMNSHIRGLAVMEKGEFKGFVTRRCFLERPVNKVIMVDHNEPAQSIEGIETADVVEIVDHHRLDSLSTTMPIFIAAEPLGSVNTIIYQLYMRHGIMPDQYAARTMLTGIIADTLILRSPTTTMQDMQAVEMLARLAKVPSVQEFGEKLFSITDNLSTQDPDEAILSDFKKYENGGTKMGIGQCEVTTLTDVGEYAQTYIDALQKIADSQGLDWTLLMVTDVLRENSVLLASNHKANRDLPYAKLAKQIYDMPGVMSRKKQLLPVLLSVTSA
ncbi:MAG: putative manganese-dependent inorganic diphosphatase [Mogibacterium sp.]|nr:putative manganese-dependent inorganic diphosphatase [Mogibacterium sp.]MBR4090347.1 putative manganese-dependent inorganic diphosphatase [Mogibacterium sp.]